MIRTVPGKTAPYFVRLRYDTVAVGIRGTDEFVVDLRTGRFVERDEAGPASMSNGFDGRRTWSADATGLAQIEDSPDDRSSTLVMSYLLGGPPAAAAPRVERLPASGQGVRLNYPALSRGFDVAVDAASGRPRDVIVYGGGDHGRIAFAAYERHGGLIVPSRLRFTSIYGAEYERLRSVVPLAAVPDRTFAPPPAPRDAFARGVVRIPLELHWYGPAIRVRIDGGPPLRMLLDTGSTFALSPSTALAARLREVGRMKTGGIGPHPVAARYVTVRRLSIGGAELRDQVMQVFDLGFEGGRDVPAGIVGYELLARFAARLDFARGRLELARDGAALRPRGRRMRIVLAATQPAVDGAVDGLRGAITIDTGSMAALDVNAPAVREHDLLRRYHAREVHESGGIGGSLVSWGARARSVRLGPVVVRNIPIELDETTSGAMNDPTSLANAGIPLLRRFVLVLDYRGRAMYLDPVR